VKARNQISFLPADIAADSIAAIFGCRAPVARTMHVTVDRYYNMMDITRIITKNFGYQFVYHDIPGFVTELRRRCTIDDPLYPLLEFFEHSHGKVAAMQDKRYYNDNYRRAKQLSGIERSDQSLEETVSYLMAYMLAEGLITGPAVPPTSPVFAHYPD
jgi:hypothetical protein